MDNEKSDWVSIDTKDNSIGSRIISGIGGLITGGLLLVVTAVVCYVIFLLIGLLLESIYAVWGVWGNPDEGTINTFVMPFALFVIPACVVIVEVFLIEKRYKKSKADNNYQKSSFYNGLGLGLVAVGLIVFALMILVGLAWPTLV